MPGKTYRKQPFAVCRTLANVGAWRKATAANERERKWEAERVQRIEQRGFPLTRRALAALARFREAATDRDRETVLRWAGLEGPEAAATAALARNLEAVGAYTDYRGSNTYRPELMEQILAGLDLPPENDGRFITALGARTIGERYELEQALARWREQKMSEDVEVMEVDADQTEEVPYVTKVELTKAALEKRGMDLFGAISTDVKNEIAKEIDSTYGSVDQNIRVLRKREHRETTNGSGPSAGSRPRVEHTAPEPVAAPPPVPNPTNPTNEQIEVIIDSLIALGLQWVKPECIQENLRVLVATYRGRK